MCSELGALLKLIVWEQGILTLEISFLEHFEDPEN
jgi:hypothetical protein